MGPELGEEDLVPWKPWGCAYEGLQLFSWGTVLGFVLCHSEWADYFPYLWDARAWLRAYNFPICLSASLSGVLTDTLWLSDEFTRQEGDHPGH